MTHASHYDDRRSHQRKRGESRLSSQKHSITFLSRDSQQAFWIVARVIQRPDREVLVLLSQGSTNTLKIESIIRGHVIGDHICVRDGTYIGVYEQSHTLCRMKGDSDRYSLGVRREQTIATNIDTIVIVASVSQPHFQPGFLDRYLLLSEYCQIPAVIVLTKSDLALIPHDLLAPYRDILKLPIFITSSDDPDSLSSLRSYLSDKVSVFVGKSGVGKSTLTNCLLGREVATEGEVSRIDQQGRHTTTGSSLYSLPDGGYIIDTPGIRSLDFLELKHSEIRLYMSDIAKIGLSCHYRSCLHQGEDGCAIQDAIKTGLLSKARYESYIRLLNEAKK
ncbi:MAG: ribosome small subunit-dependent GTPase A [Candidatus Gracilibacteria bacterium]